MLFYEKMFGDLEVREFEINPYDPCVSNNTVEGEQLRITWHMEDLKILLIDRRVVLDTIIWMESIYSDMHGTHVKQHEYLGMRME